MEASSTDLTSFRAAAARTGEFELPNGDKYTGGLAKGWRSGQGVYEFAGGGRCSGTWRDGLLHGPGGALTASDGTAYTGDFVAGLPHGRGSILFPDGRAHTGWWRKGAMHGDGSMTWVNGDAYVGSFRHDTRHGHGVYTYADGSVYEGRWKEGRRTGLGVMTWPDGSRYEGAFENGRGVEPGTFFTPTMLRLGLTPPRPAELDSLTPEGKRGAQGSVAVGSLGGRQVARASPPSTRGKQLRALAAPPTTEERSGSERGGDASRPLPPPSHSSAPAGGASVLSLMTEPSLSVRDSGSGGRVRLPTPASPAVSRGRPSTVAAPGGAAAGGHSGGSAATTAGVYTAQRGRSGSAPRLASRGGHAPSSSLLDAPPHPRIHEALSEAKRVGPSALGAAWLELAGPKPRAQAAAGYAHGRRGEAAGAEDSGEAFDERKLRRLSMAQLQGIASTLALGFQ